MGAEIHRARTARRWTQDQLASVAGVGRNTIVSVENGRPVRSATLAKLRAALELNDEEAARDIEHDPRLSRASDIQLLAEVTRRMARNRQGGMHTPDVLEVRGIPEDDEDGSDD